MFMYRTCTCAVICMHVNIPEGSNVVLFLASVL